MLRVYVGLLVVNYSLGVDGQEAATLWLSTVIERRDGCGAGNEGWMTTSGRTGLDRQI